MEIRTCTVCRLHKVNRASSLRLVLDPEVARLALARNLKFDRNTTHPLRLNLKTSPYFFDWIEGTNMRGYEVGSMPMVPVMNW